MVPTPPCQPPTCRLLASLKSTLKRAAMKGWSPFFTSSVRIQPDSTKLAARCPLKSTIWDETFHSGLVFSRKRQWMDSRPGVARLKADQSVETMSSKPGLRSQLSVGVCEELLDFGWVATAPAGRGLESKSYTNSFTRSNQTLPTALPRSSEITTVAASAGTA